MMAEDEPVKPLGRRKRRIATVYDAVAGRVGYEGFLKAAHSSRNRDTTSTSNTAVPAEEVLFRRKDAPVRYQEDDYYFAHRFLAQDQQLPQSDLLKAIHAYAADYYSATDNEKDSLMSLDETALLAIGILLEETVKQVLGDTGHLALAENRGET